MAVSQQIASSLSSLIITFPSTGPSPLLAAPVGVPISIFLRSYNAHTGLDTYISMHVNLFASRSY